MFVDVLVIATVDVTMLPQNSGVIFQNEIYPPGHPFTAAIADTFLVLGLDASSLADADAKIKAGGNAMTFAFRQKRSQQYQNQNTPISAARMDAAVGWSLTLLYMPSPQRNDQSLIQVQI